jgi:hypothetical protein
MPQWRSLDCRHGVERKPDDRDVIGIVLELAPLNPASFSTNAY